MEIHQWSWWLSRKFPWRRSKQPYQLDYRRSHWKRIWYSIELVWSGQNGPCVREQMPSRWDIIAHMWDSSFWKRRWLVTFLWAYEYELSYISRSHCLPRFVSSKVPYPEHKSNVALVATSEVKMSEQMLLQGKAFVSWSSFLNWTSLPLSFGPHSLLVTDLLAGLWFTTVLLHNFLGRYSQLCLVVKYGISTIRLSIRPASVQFLDLGCRTKEHSSSIIVFTV